MRFSAQTLPYSQTNSFSKIVLDYLDAAPLLAPFAGPPVSNAGVQQAIEQREQHKVNRAVLVANLEQQYAAVQAGPAVWHNIQSLRSENTYTICTAHQPNLFTGPLYFIYKILHAIKLAAALKAQFPQYHFVPVYYMGCEDADLAELNHFTVEGKKYVWHTAQTGAVGRMQVDAQLEQMIGELQGQLAPLPHGGSIINLLRKHFRKGVLVQDATFALVHELFDALGLVVLIPDNAALKQLMGLVLEDELFRPVSSQLVEATSDRLAQHYNVQAHPRAINLFYLENGIRERILRDADGFEINNTNLRFSDSEMQALLKAHPERFSPNVILRGLFQEMILPNVAFIGGGGELAYWLQLKAVFEHYHVPFPVLVLRNSFLLVQDKWKKKIDRLGFSVPDFFHNTDALLKQMALQQATHPLSLNGKLEQAEALFDAIQLQAQNVDPTLSQHVAALKTVSINKLKGVETKMLRAEKRKHGDASRQIDAIRSRLFPGNGLQERAEGFLSYYAALGPEFISALYHHSPALEQQFTVIHIAD